MKLSVVIATEKDIEEGEKTVVARATNHAHATPAKVATAQAAEILTLPATMVVSIYDQGCLSVSSVFLKGLKGYPFNPFK